jgi:L-lysine exporter family protein LysE/ArgO
MVPSSFITGLTLSASLIVAIGAQNAFVLRQGLKREHVAAIVLFCVGCDLMFIVAGVAGMSSFLRRLPLLALVMTATGAVFLGGYGVYALGRAMRPQTLSTARAAAAGGLRAAMGQMAGFTFLNPHVYLDVALIGAVGAQQPDGQRAWFVLGASMASCVWFSALGFGARVLSPVFARPRAWRILDSAIALIMFALALRLIRQALQV